MSSAPHSDHPDLAQNQERNSKRNTTAAVTNKNQRPGLATTTPSSSIPSRLSFLLPSANVGRTSSSPSSRFTLPTSASSAAITAPSSGESNLSSSPEALQGRRSHPDQRQPSKTGPAKDPIKRGQHSLSASESLRWVASSSPLNSIETRQASQDQSEQDKRDSAPHTRKRLDSRASIASTHSTSTVRSISSTSFRNPANLLLSQRPASIYGVSPASDNVTVSGRAADSRSHLTALGHASQVQVQSQASSSNGKRGNRPTQKSSRLAAPPLSVSPRLAAAVPVLHPPPQRSHSLASRDSDDGSQRYGSFDSHRFDQSGSGASSSGGNAQQRNRSGQTPRRRPQSFLVKPPGEPSNTTTRHIGPRPSTVFLPSSYNESGIKGSMSKRGHNEIEAANNAASSEAGSLSKWPAVSDGDATVRRRKPTVVAATAPLSSRRRTWFGLGGSGSGGGDAATDDIAARDAATSSATATADEDGDGDGDDDDDERRRTIRPHDIAAFDGGGDEPPPPMDEAEAAFRASLGLSTGVPHPSENSRDETLLVQRGKHSATVDADAAARASRTLPEDSQSTLQPARSRNADRAVHAARRVTWFGWGGADAEETNGDKTRRDEGDKRLAASTAAALQQSSEEGDRQDEPKPNATNIPAPDRSHEHNVAELSVMNDKASNFDGDGSGSGSGLGAEPSRIRTIKKRGWLGMQYEVQEEEAEDPAAPPPHVKMMNAAAEGDGHDTNKASAVPSTDPQYETGEPTGNVEAASQRELGSQQSVLSLRGLWSRGGKLPDAVEVVPSSRSCPSAAAQAEPAAATSTTTEDAGNGTAEEAQPAATGSAPSIDPAGTWRWSLWRSDPDSARGPESNASIDGASAGLDPPKNDVIQSQAATTDAGPHSQEKTMEPEAKGSTLTAAAAAPEDRRGAPSYSDSTASWTYSLNLASWVPTWAYNAQKEAEDVEQRPERDGGQQSAEGSGDVAIPPPGPLRTPAEQVKADALARPELLPTSPSVFDPGKAVLNEATRQGWISYFSSRSANRAKQIEAPPTDDDGLEVMDISDMHIDGAGPSRVVRPSASKVSERPAGRSGASSGPSTPVSHSTPAFSARPASKPTSVANSDNGHPSTPFSKSKENTKGLGKAALVKASNASAALALSVGSAKRKDGAATPTSVGQATPNTVAAQQVQIALAPAPNLVLPSFEDTFTRAPRVWAPKVGVLERMLSAVNSYLFGKLPDLERMKRPTRYSAYAELTIPNISQHSPGSVGGVASGGRRAPGQHLSGKAKTTGAGSSKDKGQEEALKEIAASAQALPRAWPTLGHFERVQTMGTQGVGKIVVIGVHGWFTQSIFKSIVGEPTGTSLKFATMQAESIRRHFSAAGLDLNPEAITVISLQGDGKVADRVDRLFAELLSRPQWVKDLAEADAVFLSAHSQGAVVATQLLARLIEQRQVRPERSRVCLLAMCGIHHGPFAHLRSSITSSYISYFETAAAKELFEFQSSQAPVSAQYTASLKIILDAGVKAVYVGSADDNVVPLYSALNSSNSHPSILRALYIDGQAFPKVDFLTNLLVLCVAVKNAGLNDHNLLTLLSVSVAGSLYGGTGHSKVYEERAVYDLATRYLLEVSHPLSEPTQVPGYLPNSGGSGAANVHATRPSSSSSSSSLSAGAAAKEGEGESQRRPSLVSDHFEAQRWNPYELPWSLRGLFEDKHVRALFAEDIVKLLDLYDEWNPDAKNKTLKDLQWRLAPMRSIARPKVERPADEEQQEAAAAATKKASGAKDKGEGALSSGGKAGSSKL